MYTNGGKEPRELSYSRENSGLQARRGKKKKFLKEKTCGGFACGAVVENPPANARDTGSSPGPGRSHMPRSNKAREPQPLKPAHLEPVLCNKRSHHNEKPAHRNEE